MKSVFHLALNVTDLEQARTFYGGLLGCAEGRSAPTWIDFDFFGHQLSLHLGDPVATQNSGKVGDHSVPMPHFGAVLPFADWRGLATKLEDQKIDFIIPPSVRFDGAPGEQWTMFFRDPSRNVLEIKGFRNFDTIFVG